MSEAEPASRTTQDCGKLYNNKLSCLDLSKHSGQHYLWEITWLVFMSGAEHASRSTQPGRNYRGVYMQKNNPGGEMIFEKWGKKIKMKHIS